jgi:methionyl aminopeptidase
MDRIQLKTPKEIEIMAKGGHILAMILHEMAKASKIGVSTKDLDYLAEDLCKKYGVIPSCKGYHGFPAAYCSCVNDVVEHGIPSAKEILKDGDVFTIDMVVKYEGFHTDAAITVPIGNASQENLDFIYTVKKARDSAIAKVKPGRRIGDLAAIMEYTVRSRGYSPVYELVGHGIGREMHEAPEVPSYGDPGTGPALVEGMVIAIEPVIAKGNSAIEISKQDGWTARVKDGSISAVFEHTVAVTKDGCRVLTI